MSIIIPGVFIPGYAHSHVAAAAQSNRARWRGRRRIPVQPIVIDVTIDVANVPAAAHAIASAVSSVLVILPQTADFEFALSSATACITAVQPRRSFPVHCISACISLSKPVYVKYNSPVYVKYNSLAEKTAVTGGWCLPITISQTTEPRGNIIACSASFSIFRDALSEEDFIV